MAAHLPGHYASGTAEHQGFPEITLIKEYGAVYRWDTALVPAVLNPLAHPFKNPLGMQEALWNLPLVVRRAETEHIGIETELCAHACSERIPVHSHNTCQGTAIGIKGRRAVVCLHLECNVIMLVECDYPCVVLEYRSAPVIITKTLPDLRRALPYAGIKEAVHHLFITVFINVPDTGIENLVLAVL